VSSTDKDFKKDSILSDLPDDVLSKLFNRSWQAEGTSGMPVYLSDDSANLLYFLKSGRVRLYYPTSQQKRITMDFLEPGALFGESALMEFEVRGEAAETVEDSRLQVFPGDYFRRVMEDSQELFRTVFDFINNRRRRVQNRLRTLVYEDARKRVIYVLLDFVHGLGPTGGSIESDTLDLTHQELADMAGLARPTTTKILNALEDEGALALDKSGITLTEPIQLKKEIHILESDEENV
jgi:CRP/FNR family transcriptional regulator